MDTVMKIFICLLLVIAVLSGCASAVSDAPVVPTAPQASAVSPSPAPSVPSPAPDAVPVPSSSVSSSRTISWDQASSYIGQRMTVYGPVASTNYAARSNGQPTFLNLGRPYPEQGFTVVIWGRDRSKFPSAPEKYYAGKTVHVTGLVEEYRGVPEIIVTDPGQIEVR
jgi:DNA/RNA endonuclease YhcR with UshA esterase domain